MKSDKKVNVYTNKIHDVKEMLTIAADMETSSANDYNMWANECSKNADSVSKTLFESLVQDEVSIE